MTYVLMSGSYELPKFSQVIRARMENMIGLSALWLAAFALYPLGLEGCERVVECV
jgi:hypothetical protein